MLRLVLHFNRTTNVYGRSQLLHESWANCNFDLSKSNLFVIELVMAFTKSFFRLRTSLVFEF